MYCAMIFSPFVFALIAGASGVSGTEASTSTEPDWFQTRPQSYQGPTATGTAPFLAQINPVQFGQKVYSANSPLVTNEPIRGANGRNIFHHLGSLSPYWSPEDGFGVEEYPLPPGTNITQMHLLHRHGSRYPPGSEKFQQWADGIQNATRVGTGFTGALAFLNEWSYGLGAEILVPKGREEMYSSGVLHYYNYGHLYDRNMSHKLVVRTTTQDRMLKSAENFLAGFFGLHWTEHANLLAMIEQPGFNNSLIGYYSCPKAMENPSPVSNISTKWIDTYLGGRTAELRKLSGAYNWTTTDSYKAQSLCAYETVSYGYSKFCSLFSFTEFEHFGYRNDLIAAASMAFQCPTGRAQGIAWVQEFLARVEGHHLLTGTIAANANTTLDSNPITFPIDQNLYLDFTHDGGIIGVLTALGFRQFAQFLPPTRPPSPSHQLSTSKIIPFAGRTNIEIIRAPHAVKTHRRRRCSKGSCQNDKDKDKEEYVLNTGETWYIHFLQNQRTIPLHASFPECEYRDDGWCELNIFLQIQKASLEKSQFEHACFGNWSVKAYGEITDGVPARD